MRKLLTTPKRRAAAVQPFRAAVWCVLAVMLIAANALTVLTVRADGGAQPYERLTTYIADTEHGIYGDDRNWELLNDAEVSGGSITGFGTGESGFYGIGLRHRLAGRGTSVVSARIEIPEGKSGFVKFGLRLDDSLIGDKERKGLRLCVDAQGQLGVLNAAGTRIVAQPTGYSFTEGRRIVLKDNADTGVIAVYFEDGGQNVKVAECVIDGREVTLNFTDAGIEPVKVNYSHTIYRDGYISITTPVPGVRISDLSVTVPSYSLEPYRNAAVTVIGGGDPEPDGDVDGGEDAASEASKGVNTDLIIFGVVAAAMLGVIAFIAVLLVRSGKKTAAEPAAEGAHADGAQ